MSYEIILTTSSRKQLQKLPKQTQINILNGLQKLAENPFAANVNVKKMQGEENVYRLRTGDYRIIYELYNNIMTIEVIKIAHRQNIY